MLERLASPQHDVDAADRLSAISGTRCSTVQSEAGAKITRAKSSGGVGVASNRVRGYPLTIAAIMMAAKARNMTLPTMIDTNACAEM